MLGGGLRPPEGISFAPMDNVARHIRPKHGGPRPSQSNLKPEPKIIRRNGGLANEV